LIITFLMFSYPINSFGTDNKKYCEYGSYSIKIYLLQRKINDSETQNEFVKLIQDKLKSLNPGDRLTMSVFSGDGKKNIIDGCNPKCPKVGFFEGLTTSCLAPQADRDKKIWFQKISKELSRVVKRKTNGNLFKELNNIQLDIKNSSNFDEHILVGSMIPDNLVSFSIR